MVSWKPPSPIRRHLWLRRSTGCPHWDLRAQRFDRAEREDFLRRSGRVARRPATDAEEEQSPVKSSDCATSINRGGHQVNRDRLRLGIEQVGQALRAVETLMELDAEIGLVLDDLNTTAVIEDSARTFGDYARRLESEPERLEVVEERLGVFAVFAESTGRAQ